MNWLADDRTVVDHGSVLDHPDIYDLTFDGHQLDIPFYQSLARGQSGQAILECGVGTGRVAVELARLGFHVVGIDFSLPMLQRLRSREIENSGLDGRILPILTDIRNFSLHTKFELILCPFMTFNYLMESPDQLAFLTNVAKHLHPNGSAWIELMTLGTLPEIWRNDGIERLVLRGRLSPGGSQFDLHRIVRFDQAHFVVEQDRYYRFYDDSGKLVDLKKVTWRNRFVGFSEFRLQAEMAGLQVSGTYGDHNGAPVASDSEFLLVELMLR